MLPAISRRLGPLIALALLSACVTINVYFPAAAAEQAADRFIEDVWQLRQQQDPAPETPPQGRLWLPSRPLVWLLEVAVPSAHAQANIDIDTPAINRLKSAMTARFERLRPFYQSGAIGLTQDGLVKIRDLNAVPLAQRGLLNQLVAEQNRDRNALYQEIARANNHPQWVDEIRATFARQWIQNARPGWWYIGGDGQWRQK
ncbi:MAG: YdbL family protein [Candidatus Competibacteraceae bacterium]|nr:YdbL family protein [Candidatus Competibacteraceae bacterium]